MVESTRNKANSAPLEFRLGPSLAIYRNKNGIRKKEIIKTFELFQNWPTSAYMQNIRVPVYFGWLLINPHKTEVSESLIRRRGVQMAPLLDIDQIMDFANSVFTGA